MSLLNNNKKLAFLVQAKRNAHFCIFFSNSSKDIRFPDTDMTSSNEESRAGKAEISEFTLCSAESDTSLIY